jgi:hypothetical protein
MSRQRQADEPRAADRAEPITIIDTTGVELASEAVSPLWAGLPFVSVEPDAPGAVVPFAATLRHVS